MIDLRNYKQLLKELVAAENKSDKNWKWKLKSVSQKKALIWWEYLNYCGSENECFVLTLDMDEGEEEGWIFAHDPDNEIIDCHMVTEIWPSAKRIGALCEMKSGLKFAFEDITYHAHSRY